MQSVTLGLNSFNIANQIYRSYNEIGYFSNQRPSIIQ